MVVNTHRMKAVHGRQADEKDAEWIIEFLHHGLLTESYITDKE